MIVDTNCLWPDQKLRSVMNRIAAAQAELENDRRFRSIDEYLRRLNL